MEYDFTLTYRLPAGGAGVDQITRRLGDAGCDDALVGVGQAGRIALNFTRDAPSAESAIISAIGAVKIALPGARLIEAGPDLVGLSDVAEVVGVTRQNMRKLTLAHANTFPVPVHEGSAAVWHLALVLLWLKDRGSYCFEQAVLDVAASAMQVNIAKESVMLLPRIRREMHDFLS